MDMPIKVSFCFLKGDLERLFRKYGKVDRVDLKSVNLACYNYIFCMLNFYSRQDMLIISTWVLQ
ncbi:hypothetical protein Hanom_Chr09g00773971 [Helianthus anomalus]